MEPIMNKVDPNEAASDKWALVLPGGLNLVARKTTDFDLPGFNADGTIGPKGGGDTMISIPADTIMFDPFVFTFLVDETYSNYIEVVKRIIASVRAENEDLFFDAIVMPLTNRGKDQGLTFEYINSRITNMSTVTYDTDAQVRSLTCTMTMMFENFRIRKNGNIVLSTIKSDTTS